MTYRLLVAAGLALAAAACTRAPLTDTHVVLRGATRGDIPRDGNGEPILDRVKPVPPGAIIPSTSPAPPR